MVRESHETRRDVLDKVRERTQGVHARRRRGARQLGSRLIAEHHLLLERREWRRVAADGVHRPVHSNPVAHVRARVRRAQREYVLEHRSHAVGVLDEELARRVEDLELRHVRLVRKVSQRSLQHGKRELKELLSLLSLSLRRVRRVQPLLLLPLRLLRRPFRRLLVHHGDGARARVLRRIRGRL